MRKKPNPPGDASSRAAPALGAEGPGDAEILSAIRAWPDGLRALAPETIQPRVGIARSVLATVAAVLGAPTALVLLVVAFDDPAPSTLEWWSVLLVAVALLLLTAVLVAWVASRTRAHLSALADVRAAVADRYRNRRDLLDRRTIDADGLDAMMRTAREDVARINTGMQFPGFLPSVGTGAWCIPLVIGPWVAWDLGDPVTTFAIGSIWFATLPLGACALALARRRIGLVAGLSRQAIAWSGRLDGYAEKVYPHQGLGGESWSGTMRRQPAMLLFGVVLVALLVAFVAAAVV